MRGTIEHHGFKNNEPDRSQPPSGLKYFGQVTQGVPSRARDYPGLCCEIPLGFFGMRGLAGRNGGGRQTGRLTDKEGTEIKWADNCLSTYEMSFSTMTVR